jgi:sugar lactone lactonase YvrE
LKPVACLAALVVLCNGCNLILPFSQRATDGRELDATEQGALDGRCACVIAGSCLASGALDDQDPCRMCDPAVSRAQWSAAPGCVVTLAGNGHQGFVDGPALTARFDGPLSVVTDGAGRVFVADWSVNRVRQIWQGQVTTVAGNGDAGHVDGPAADSELNAPMGLALDGAGDLYFSDKGGNRIRLLHQGQVSTVAGSGKAGAADGPALLASFASPQGLAVTEGGTIYVADSGNNRVRQIAGGTVSTLCGSTAGWVNGPVDQAKLSYPTGLAAGPAGEVIIADEQNAVIRRVASGQVTTLAGTPGGEGFADGPAASARFIAPHDVAVDGDGTVYVADCGNGRIRKIQDGQVTTVAGSWGFADGPFASARFACPVSIDLDGAGHLFVADGQNYRVRVLNLNP